MLHVKFYTTLLLIGSLHFGNDSLCPQVVKHG